MTKNQQIDATLFASTHNNVEKRLHIVAIVISSFFTLAGIACFLITTQLPETSSTIGMSLMVLGTALLLTAIFRFFWKSKHLVYTPTGSTVSAKSFYFDPSCRGRLQQAIQEGGFHFDPALRSVVSGSIRLDVLMAEDGSFGAVQLFEYASYTYKSLTPIAYLSGEEAKEAKQFILSL